MRFIAAATLACSRSTSRSRITSRIRRRHRCAPRHRGSRVPPRRIRVFDSDDDILLLSEQIARSTWSSDINPVTVSFRSPVGGDYTVLVHGVLGFDFIADPFVLEGQGTAGTLTFQGEDTASRT